MGPTAIIEALEENVDDWDSLSSQEQFGVILEASARLGEDE